MFHDNSDSMLPHRIATIVAPIGAIGMFFASQTAYRAMWLLTGPEPDGSGNEALWTSLTMTTYVGLFGVILLSVGMVLAARQRLPGTLPVKLCFFVAGIAFGLAVLLVAYGNTQLSLAFHRLATSEAVETEPFLNSIGMAKLPLSIGYVLVVVGAALVFGAGLLAGRRAADAKSTFNTLSLFVVVASSFLLIIAALLTVSSIDSLADLMASAATVKPARLASDVVGTLNAVYTSLPGLAGFSVACLLMSLAKGPIEPDATEG